jgi:hypothetical protein
MCGTIDYGHIYDEYLVLLAKSGMTSQDQTGLRGEASANDDKENPDVEKSP